MVIDKAGPDALRDYYQQLKVALEEHIQKQGPRTPVRVRSSPVKNTPLQKLIQSSTISPTAPPSTLFSRHPLEKELEALQQEEARMLATRHLPSHGTIDPSGWNLNARDVAFTTLIVALLFVAALNIRLLYQMQSTLAEIQRLQKALHACFSFF